MLFRFACRQCGHAFYPWKGPATSCPKCLAEPVGNGFQGVVWFGATALILIGAAYLAVERDTVMNVGRDQLHRFVAFQMPSAAVNEK